MSSPSQLSMKKKNSPKLGTRFNTSMINITKTGRLIYGAIPDKLSQNVPFDLGLPNMRLRRCRLKRFLIHSSGVHFVQRSEAVCAISTEGIEENVSVHLF